MLPTRLAALAALLASVVAAGGQEPAPPKTPRVRAVVFSPDGSMLAAAAGEPKGPARVTVWDAAGKLLHSTAFEAGVPALAFSPDGSALALAGADGKVRVTDPKTGKMTRTLEHPKEVRAVAFGPAGTLATAAADGLVRVWDATSGKELAKTPEYRKPVIMLAFSPDGKRLAGSDDAQVCLWDAATGRQEWAPAEPYYSTAAVAFTADGRWLVRVDGSDGSVQVTDPTTGSVRLRKQNPGGVRHAGYAPAAEVAVTSYAFDTSRLTVHRLRLEPTEAERRRIAELLAKLDADAADVREAAAAELAGLGVMAEPFLKRAANESPSAEVRLRARKAREKLLEAVDGSVTVSEGGVASLAVSPDGRRVAVGGTDGAVRLIEATSGKVTAVLRPDRLP